MEWILLCGGRCSVSSYFLTYKKLTAYLQVHEHVFPTIWCIARDFLAIPASSTSVEHLFSSANHIVTNIRSSMGAETAEKLICTKFWMQEGFYMC